MKSGEYLQKVLPFHGAACSTHIMSLLAILKHIKFFSYLLFLIGQHLAILTNPICYN